MLESVIALLQSALVFLVGLMLRAVIGLVIIAAVALPIAGLLLAWRGVRQLSEDAIGLRRVGHVRWRRGNYYTPGHLWLRPHGHDTLRVGIDDVAQRVLPEVEVLTLPWRGTALKKGDVLASIRCFNGTVRLRSPLAGVVAAVNDAPCRTPAVLHKDPYRRGWLVEMEPDTREHTRLPSGRSARDWIAREDARLCDFLERQLGIAAADGGDLMVPPHRLLTRSQWDAVTRGFLDAESR